MVPWNGMLPKYYKNFEALACNDWSTHLDMNSSIIYVRNMVCQRCIKVVREILEKLDIEYQQVVLGEVQLKSSLSNNLRKKLKESLQKDGFDLLDDRESLLVEKIKSAAIHHVHHLEARPKQNFSSTLAQNLGISYNRLSTLFSSVEGITIEKFLILQKIERAKELILYDEMTVSQIADRLGYSSAQYLSSQFKRVTGMSPGTFRKQRPPRQGIDAH